MIVVVGIFLGAVFVVAGVSKIAAHQRWRSQSADLGIPVAIALVMPFVEIVVGALLVAQIARREVALFAAALLLAFTILLVARLGQGRRPPCACFGAWTTKPIGWGNVVRNVALIVVATALALA